MIYFKSFIYRLLIVLVVGMILFFMYKVFVGTFNNISMFAIVILAFVLSPRFEIIETKAGQSLRMKGFLVDLFRSKKNKQ